MMTLFYSKSDEVSYQLWIVHRANPKQMYTENNALVRILIPGQLTEIYCLFLFSFQGGGAKKPSTPH